MAKRRLRHHAQARPDPLVEWVARLQAAACRAEARLLEHASSAYILVAQDDGAGGIDPYAMGVGHPVEVEALAVAMTSWLETDSGIIVDETDRARSEAVGAACRELGGLADHGLILVPARSDGTEVYANHWGSELIVHQVVKALAKRTKA